VRVEVTDGGSDQVKAVPPLDQAARRALDTDFRDHAVKNDFAWVAITGVGRVSNKIITGKLEEITDIGARPSLYPASNASHRATLPELKPPAELRVVVDSATVRGTIFTGLASAVSPRQVTAMHVKMTNEELEEAYAAELRKQLAETEQRIQERRDAQRVNPVST
jgi:hypothetical protein